MRRCGVVAALLTIGLVTSAGCGREIANEVDVQDPRGVQPGAGNDDLPPGIAPAGYDGRVRGTVTVLESPDHGPQLCAGVLESYPPQCSGPDIKGWTWDGVRAESANGTTWGDYTVTGRFSDGVFTLTEPPTAPQWRRHDEATPAAACPEPSGGWVPPDAARATYDTQDQAINLARQYDGYAGVWIGWLIPDDQMTEAKAQDPHNYVLNVLTTGDVGALESKLREVWGGNLCVARAKHAEAELNRIANQLMQLPGAISSSTDIIKQTADVTAWVATEEMWRQIVREHGADVVHLGSVLKPID